MQGDRLNNFDKTRTVGILFIKKENFYLLFPPFRLAVNSSIHIFPVTGFIKKSGAGLIKGGGFSLSFFCDFQKIQNVPTALAKDLRFLLTVCEFFLVLSKTFVKTRTNVRNETSFHLKRLFNLEQVMYEKFKCASSKKRVEYLGMLGKPKPYEFLLYSLLLTK